MLNKYIVINSVLALFLCQNTIFAQPTDRYSAVNPILFHYTVDDIYLRPLTKHNNGANIISPNPTTYPWEARLENGMPNVLVDNNRNTAIYISSFVNYASNPPSKVGAMVYTNNSGNLSQWTRPNAGLFWYNPSGVTSDQKISPTYSAGYQPTNIVAVDIESLGIYDDYETDNKPIKLIYLPQRESHNSIISSYQMGRGVDNNGVLQGFALMKNDRQIRQENYTFPFINGDTHMNFFKQNGEYYFVSRMNSKRAYLLEGETLPLHPDNRKRYRRETVTKVGASLQSENVTAAIALDMSDLRWEPYSMQPFRLPGFENDIWWGLVTMFGTEGDVEVQHRQRTELAYSSDGITWKYLKPGIPFLDNGTDPSSDDYGCINIAKPVFNTKFSANPNELFYFYAASNVRHIDGRNPGISLAKGKYGKIAGLTAGSVEKRFSSVDIPNTVPVDSLTALSLYNCFYLGTKPFPGILADVTQDPRGYSLNQLNSYVALLYYSYDSASSNGKGNFLGGVLGSSVGGTTTISDSYEAVPFVYYGIDGNGKHYLLNHFKYLSNSDTTKIVRMSTQAPIPVVTEALVKNAVFYGIGYNLSSKSYCPLQTQKSNSYLPSGLWQKSLSQSATHYTEDFSNSLSMVNRTAPVCRETGTIAVKMTPSASLTAQCVMRMYGQSTGNDIQITLEPSGAFCYTIRKDNIPFATMTITPLQGQSFIGKEVTLTVESVPASERKHGAQFTEDATVFRVDCPALNFVQSVQQPILWNWKHPEGSITDSDRANARAFSFLSFSAFVAGMNKITIGASDQTGNNRFVGRIFSVQIADKLPNGNNDFWN